MKKKMMLAILTGVMLFSMTACGNQKPDLEEVEKAIANGEVTIEDALDKEWITKDWAEEYLNANSHAAADKTVSFAIGDFETTTVSGEKYGNENIMGTTFWAFLDLTTEESKEWMETLKDVYPELQEKGAQVLVCVKNNGEDQTLEKMPFPMIIYNESVRNALDHMNMAEMAEELPNCGSWFANHYFASSWNSMITKEQLLNEADIFININNGGELAETEEEMENAAAAIQ